MNTEQFDGHTPGPWDADYDPYVATLDKGESMDVLTIRVPTSEDDEVAWTNQHLAAAAPDLLAEVKRLREDLLTYQPPEGFDWDDEHPRYSIEDWVLHLSSSTDLAGYWEWVNFQIDIEGDEEE